MGILVSDIVPKIDVDCRWGRSSLSYTRRWLPRSLVLILRRTTIYYDLQVLVVEGLVANG